MNMGLDPKSVSPDRQLKNWSDLNAILKSNFENPLSPLDISATIFVDEYEMSAEEMIREGEKQGYTVEKSDSSVGPVLVFK